MRAPVHPLLQLQHTIGNQAVSRLIQTKLNMSHPGDVYEQEADRLAEQVTSMHEPQLQRVCAHGGGARATSRCEIITRICGLSVLR